jgi:hypothetical protein
MVYPIKTQITDLERSFISQVHSPFGEQLKSLCDVSHGACERKISTIKTMP